MPDKLLYYRIRTNSITSKNRFKQVYTIRYIRLLYKYFKRNGVDKYKYEHYLQYIDNKKINDKKVIDKFNRYFNKYHNGKKDITEKKYITGFFKVFHAVLFSGYYRNSIIEKFKYTLIYYLK
ncbi:hypothetical protein UACE39S_01437 [Ureibacillus acetophenoni]